MVDLSTLPIMIVEENTIMSDLLVGILRGALAEEIECCISPQEACAVIPHWNAGLIITGYKMKPESGIEFVRRLRSDPSLCFLSKPIIMTTAVAPNRALIDEISTVGIDALVPKPIVPSTLLQGIERSLVRARQRVEMAILAARDKQRERRNSVTDAAGEDENIWSVK